MIKSLKIEKYMKMSEQLRDTRFVYVYFLNFE